MVESRQRKTMPKTITYCRVDNCETRCHGKGYCLMHYKRVMKHGTTEKHTWEPRKGYTLDDELKRRISATLKGRTLSEGHKAHIAEGMQGKVSHGEASHMWKGNDVGYGGVHVWVRRTLGTPSLCENCGTTSGITFDWANLSYEYKRDISDWARLCRRCHFLIDGVGLYMRHKNKEYHNVGK